MPVFGVGVVEASRGLFVSIMSASREHINYDDHCEYILMVMDSDT